MKYSINLLTLLAITLTVSVTGRAQTNPPPAGLLLEVFTDIPGSSLADLTNAAVYPASPQTTSYLTNSVETPRNYMDNYGQRVRGFLRAPASGEYTFWIASDDQSVLHLSTNENPANIQELAFVSNWTDYREWDKEPNQMSAPVTLEQGNLYYIEILMKDGSGGDSLSLRWQLPDGTIEEPVPAGYFVPADVPVIPPIISRQPESITVREGEPAVFSVEVANPDPVHYQWNKNDSRIPGANTASVTNKAAGIGDNGARYMCVITNAIGETKSAEAVLQVIKDTTQPRIISAYNTSTGSVKIVFSEPVSITGNLADFAFDHDVTVKSLGYGTELNVVILNVSPLQAEVQYTITVNNVTDRASAKNPMTPDTKVSFVTSAITPQNIDIPPDAGTFKPVKDGYDISISRSHIGGETDMLQFSCEQLTGDFDIKVRVKSLDPSNPWAMAGLMAREDLDGNSAFFSAMATPGISGAFSEFRRQKGAESQRTGSFPVNYPNTWLRVKRSGDKFFGYAGFDGLSWKLLGTSEINMTNQIYFGIALSSHSDTGTTAAKIRDLNPVTFTGPDTELPKNWEPLGPCSRNTGLVISEIHYHPGDRTDDRELEFLELFNSEPVDKDISAYRIDGEITYTFPSNTVIPAGGFIVLAKVPTDVSAVYDTSNVFGPYNGRLANDGGPVRLYNELGALLLDIEYSDQPPWPAAADGAGHSLVLARASLGEDDPAAWSASSFIGGSPGRADTYVPTSYSVIMINEFLAHTDDPELDFIELYNHSETDIDISNLSLSDDPTRDKFTIPRGTIISSHGFVAFKQDQLGFALDAEGETIYLKNPAGDRILDAVRFRPQATGISSGRYPDGAPNFHELSAKTFAKPNAPLLIRDVVINELNFHPISENSDEEFVELHNKGNSTVDLSNWRISDGIDFTFPEGTIIPADGYLVVASDADYLATLYTNLDASKLVGDFQRQLSNAGERIALEFPMPYLVTNVDFTVTTNYAYVVADEVTYSDGGRWCNWADGNGSTLELINPRTDNRLGPNWGDSVETDKSQWCTISKTGVLDNGYDGYPVDNLQILLLGPGECLVDNVKVLDSKGQNLIANDTFEGGLFNYNLVGSHHRSFLASGQGHDGGNAMHLVATHRGDTGPNQIWTPLTRALSPGETVTVQCDARWLKGHPELLLRIRGNFLEATDRMPVPSIGTPGASNSIYRQNTGPAVFDTTHTPILPAADEKVVVSTRVHDPDGVSAVTLRYRVDPSLTFTEVSMNDDAEDGDKVAGDGVFSATVPGQPSGAIVAFHVTATDNASIRTSASFPADAPKRECLVRFGETMPTGNLGAYRIWVKQDTFNEWSNRDKGSNELLDATFVYGNYRAVYNMNTMYSGSPYHWGNYNTPTGNMCNYVMVFPKDNLFLGVTDFVLNAPSNLGSDDTALREQLYHWMAQQIGLPSTHRRFIHLYVNGVHRYDIFEDAVQPNREFIEEWYPENNNGELFKIEDWFEFTPNFSFHNTDATLEKFTTTGDALKLARYRWTWRKRSVEYSANDYTNIFDLVEAVNQPNTNAFITNVNALVNINQWMQTMASRHMCGDWDAYGYRRGKNMYAYKPVTDKWELLNWDISFAFGLGDGPTHDLFDVQHMDGTIDPISERMFNTPPFRRDYLRALYDLVNGPMQPASVSSFLDPHHQALIDNRINVDQTRSIKSWIASRRSYINRVLGTNEAPFEIFTSNGSSFQTNRNLIEIEGTAPIGIKTIRVNGIAYPIRWITVNHWAIQVPLSPGENQLLIEGYDLNERRFENASTQINITYTGSTHRPQNYLMFTEIMYNPLDDDAEYIELFNSSAAQAFDLSGYRIDGIDFSFPEAFIIQPLQYVVVAKDIAAFENSFGTGLNVIGGFPGRLNNAGETISLIKPSPDVPEGILIDKITYGSQPPWPTEPDGLGSSLQLIDTGQDNNRIGNWTAVQTNGFAPPRWKLGVLSAKFSGIKVQMYASPGASVWIDDVKLVEGLIAGKGTNIIQDGGFESALEDSWRLISDEATAHIDTNKFYEGASSLFLSSPTNAEPGDIIIDQKLAALLDDSKFHTLSFRYFSEHADGTVSVNIGTGPAATESLARTRLAIATPGKQNSVKAVLPELPKTWINEIQPENVSGVTDASGEREPWIELFNSETSTIDLDNFYLSDDPENLLKWEFPANAEIDADAFKLVWADAEPGETTASEWHAAFEPQPTNGICILTMLHDQRKLVVDYLDYAMLRPGLSYGLFPDGVSENPGIFQIPTPAAPNNNSFKPVAVSINEWMAANDITIADPADGDYDDWFELFNSESKPVNLSGYTLTDKPDNPSKYVIPAGVIIPARGHLLVWADEETEQNGVDTDLHVNFRLNRDGEYIGLYTPGGTLVDSVSFGAQQADVSEGRYPDGITTHTYTMPSPSPRAANPQPPDYSGAPIITGISVEADALVIEFSSIPGTEYLLQYKDSLDNVEWFTIGTPVTATNSVTRINDTSIDGVNIRFYRIKTEQ